MSGESVTLSIDGDYQHSIAFCRLAFRSVQTPLDLLDVVHCILAACRPLHQLWLVAALCCSSWQACQDGNALSALDIDQKLLLVSAVLSNHVCRTTQRAPECC